MSNTKTLIVLSIRSPHPFTDALSLHGYRVFEALTVSEVFGLVERWPDAHILITHDVKSTAAKLIRQRFMTFQAEENATIEDVLWELSHFQPSSSIQ